MKSNKLYFILSLILILVAGCKKEDLNEPAPEDLKPSIRRVIPTTSSALALADSIINFNFQLADNEELDSFFVIQRVNNTDTLIHAETLNGTFLERPFSYKVPAFADLTQITLIAYTWDNKRQYDSTLFVITKDFPRDTTQPYQLLTYSNDTIFNKLSLTGRSAFNTIARTSIVSQQAAKDIEETSTMTGTFDKSFISPNNNAFDSVFVVLNTSMFNFEATNYKAIDRAYLGNFKHIKTPSLNVNDVVILRSRIQPHYVVFKIKEIVDGPGDEDYIVFDYKRSVN